MKYKAWSSWEDVPYCLSRSSVKFWGLREQKMTSFDPNWAFLDCYSPIKFPGHMGPKINDLNPILSKNTRSVAAIKSLRFTLLCPDLDKVLRFPCMFGPCNNLETKSTLGNPFAHPGKNITRPFYYLRGKCSLYPRTTKLLLLCVYVCVCVCVCGGGGGG